MFGKPILKSYSSLVHLVSRVIDPIVIVLAAICSFGLRFSFEDMTIPSSYRILMGFGFFGVIVVFPLFNLYSSWRSQTLLKQAQYIILGWLIVVLMIIVLLFSLKISAEYSRIWLGLWAVLGLVMLIFARMIIYAFLQYQRKRGINVRYIVVIGAGALGRKVAARAKESNWMGYQIKAFFDDGVDLEDKVIDDIPVRGTLADLNCYLSNNNIDEVWIALPLRAEEKLKEMLFDIRHQTVNVKYFPDFFGFSLLNHSLTEIAGLAAVNLSETPMWGLNRIVKEIEDRVLAILILIAISPVLLIISIAIKLTSPGPVLFKQRRHGWDGRIINIYKFRTMYLHKEDGGFITQACKGDKRITKLGMFLRKTSLDELPQFFNVLQGKMSIVGPRPHAVEHNELYKDEVDRYMLRHMVKPGITGWAQINGFRGETDTIDKMKKRIEYDLFYIENWSLFFDIKIILITIFKGFFHKNAY